MPLYTIEMTDYAECDLENLGDYIAFKLYNPVAAERIVHGIRQRINELKKFPLKYKLDEDVVLADLGVRRINYDNYDIFYFIDESILTVYIIRILHSLTDYRSHLYQIINI